MSTIYFVRHGEYENSHIIPLRAKGYPLSQKGIKQIKKVANYFQNKNIFIIFSSPMLRTKQTASIIGEKLNLKIKISNLINELKSPFQEYDKKYLMEKIKNIYANQDHLKKGGETIEDIHKRVNKLVLKILKDFQGKNIIIISHGDPIMIFLNKKDFTSNILQSEVGNYKYIPKSGIVKVTFNTKNQIIGIKELDY